MNPTISKLLGLPVVPKLRFADDPDVIEAQLMLRMDRFGDRRARGPAVQQLREQTLEAYVKDLQKIDRRLASRADQNKV